MNDGEDLEKWQERRARVKADKRNGNGFGTPLAVAVRLLPTCTAGDAKAAANRTAGRSNPDSAHHDGVTLTDAVRLLPTPTSRDHKGANQRGDDTCLPGAVKLLPTPRTSDSTGSGEHGDGGPDLRTAISRLLPTPRVSASRTGRSAPSLAQAAEIVDGQVPRELTSIDEAPRSWHGASTSPPSAAGKPSSESQHPTLWTDEEG